MLTMWIVKAFAKGFTDKAFSPTIIRRIQSIKFMMDFLDRNPSAKLDIYYFNNSGVNEYNIESVNKNPETWTRHDKYVESLKWHEKRNIAPNFDLQEAIKVSRQLDCGCNFRFDRKYLTKAIFFELIDGDRNSSLWYSSTLSSGNKNDPADSQINHSSLSVSTGLARAAFKIVALVVNIPIPKSPER